jgi:DNA processing protein
VFAVPGNIYSKGSRGTNRLIQTGAKLITCVEEVLDELNLKLVTQQAQVREEIPADDTEHVVLSALTHEPLHIDELSRMLTMPIPTLSATLTVMELKGMARHVGGMSYIRCQ